MGKPCNPLVVAATAAALLALPAGAHAGAHAQEPGGAPRVLAVMAHPDDEVFVAPALARAARDGKQVTLVYATSGDAGPGVSQFEPGADLASAREGEARCSARALGIGDTLFLRLGDGTLGIGASRPGSAARSLADRLSSILQEGGFSQVITWGPDGGYGHSDHRMVSAITTQLVQAMGEDRPELLYPGIRSGTLPPVAEMQAWAQTDPRLLTHRIAYDSGDLAAAAQATACHATQFDEATRAGMMALFDQTIWQGAVHFRTAF